MTDTIVINSAPTTEAPEGHDQAMIDLVDKNATIPQDNLGGEPEVPPVDEDRPQWLPEKFKTPEDMAKAYAELESKMGKPADKADPSTETPPPADATTDDAKQALESKGLDLNEFSNEFSEKGELSAESYERLQKAGYDRDIVDQFIEGQKARATQFESSIKGEAGGAEKYNELVTWAKANLSDSEIAAYNSAVNSGNVDQAKLAVLGLSARFSKENGSDPQRMVSGGKASGEDRFESTAQLTEAMKDPRYKNDPAYRSQVQAKLSRSSVF